MRGAATSTVNVNGSADYTKIQDAVNAASVGDTILVYSGTYYETVTVNKQLELKGQDSGGGLPVINTAGLGDAISVTADGVTIDGFNAKTGSHLYNGIKVISNNNIIKNNIASNNLLGIWLYSSNNNILSNNTALNNSYGIYLDSSSNNMLSNNTPSNNAYGIYLSYGIYLNSSSNNTLIGNNASNNPFGIGLYNSINNTLRGNIANSNNFIQKSGFYFNYGTGIILSSSSNNTLIGNIASNNGNIGTNIAQNYATGITLSASRNNTLIRNNASNNGNTGFFNHGTGITLSSSSNNSLSGNNMTGNSLNFNIDGSTDSHFIQSIDTSNTVNGKPVYYIIGVSGVTYDQSTNAGWFGCINCNNITLKDSAFTNNSPGVLFWNTSNSNIQNLTLNNNNNRDDLLMGYSENNNVTNNTASSNVNGIHLEYSSNNTLSNNSASNNSYGIYLDFSSNNMLSNNSASNNLQIYLSYGIYLNSSSNNTLTNNTANSNYYGIYISSSSNNSLSGNNMKGNSRNFNIDGSTYSHFIQSIDTSNTVNGKPVYYIIGVSGVTYDTSTNAGWFGCINCNNITLKDSAFMSNSPGVLFWNTSNLNVQNITLNNNGDGLLMGYSENNNVTDNRGDQVHLEYSGNNTLASNTASISLSSSNYNTLVNNTNSNTYGISLSSSNNNTLTNNTASISLSSSNYNTLNGNNPPNSFEGIRLQYSSNNRLIGNTVSTTTGIILWSSNNNILSGNNASNGGIGIFLFSASSNNTLINNTVSNNVIVGIRLDFLSNNNTIYNNYFNNIDNFVIIYSVNNFNTTKRSGSNIIGGSYLGGNFWANPNGTGFSQTCADSNSDGICDSTYTLDGSNIDYLPLAYKFTSTPPANVSISGFSFQPQTINVTAGTTVTWTNMDSVLHTVTSDTGLFDSGSLSNGQTFSRIFNAAGN